MDIYKFDRGINITRFNSNFTMSRIVESDNLVRINYMTLDKNGVIGYHQAVTSQILLVLNGNGYVRNEKSDLIKIQAGQAVFWEKGEWHETKTDHGLTAMVIEGKELTPYNN
ncbi:cupin domain-containing protein [Tenuibacillus multivorans]|uniref:Cupin domain-containing protein n=1 Tax=Tenuibacillus multivorans TaxID=237069 RepID=A0A1H0CMC5_9BACI|nr:cupin [Tenuibacillus multivorans]GEL76243.1 hypothetical protein TMU01_04780 [Tenuibacillus multivorans]SDN58911.1 hypothetical protein SAMN05216498_2591 [Tenuibacillus multivorans]